MKRICSLLCAAAVGLSAIAAGSTAFAVNEAEAVPSWQETYLEKLRQYQNESDSINDARWDLQDLDKDGVPELLISDTGSHVSGLSYFYYENGECKELLNQEGNAVRYGVYGTVLFCPAEQLIATENLNRGIFSVGMHKCENHVVTTVLNFYNDEGYIGEENASYYVNGAKTTKTEYDQALQQYQSKTWELVGQQYDFTSFEAFSTETAENDAAASGSLGDNITWSYDAGTGCLSVSGTGKMEDPDPHYNKWGYITPWATLELKSIEISDGITNIMDSAFNYCGGFTAVTIPASVAEIGSNAFLQCTELTSVTILNPECAIADSEYTIANEVSHPLAEEQYCRYTGVIRGYAGSTAQAYAEKYGCTFESLGEAPAAETLLETGDFNGDTAVDITDAQNVLAYYTESLTGNAPALTDVQKTAADIDGDGEITLTDAQYILIYYVQNTIVNMKTDWSEIVGK